MMLYCVLYVMSLQLPHWKRLISVHPDFVDTKYGVANYGFKISCQFDVFKVTDDCLFCFCFACVGRGWVMWRGVGGCGGVWGWVGGVDVCFLLFLRLFISL